MMTWWATRAPREQVTLLVGLAGVLATLAYLLVLEPLQLQRQQAEARFKAASELAAWIDGAADEASYLRKRQAPVGEQATATGLFTLVSAKSNEAGFGNTLKRVVPDQTGAVRLWFEGVAFSALLDWVTALRDQNGILVTAIQLSREPKSPGLVRANLTLEAPGG